MSKSDAQIAEVILAKEIAKLNGKGFQATRDRAGNGLINILFLVTSNINPLSLMTMLG
jgi:hypothetical protein